ncbi:hypothetical protein [Devosia sp. LC5]|uniref:hypothetical protein n=1 Tax=Devosia sp. LC5 TaxID=1502724 RepID=UPI001362CCA7|nr:hypothetical protein [Devosia sp. LC5]
MRKHANWAAPDAPPWSIPPQKSAPPVAEPHDFSKRFERKTTRGPNFCQAATRQIHTALAAQINLSLTYQRVERGEICNGLLAPTIALTYAPQCPHWKNALLHQNLKSL